MTANIDALGTSGDIKATYRRYLQSLLAVRDPDIDAALRAAIDSTPMLDKGPYLEATPPYAAGASLQQLINEGVLDASFTELGSAVLPLDRPLYVHQEQAIRKATAGRNVVVATGTGSGKTESFLLPILDSLVREHAAGTLGAGVRALLLYPMNALANDQLKRLRQVLAAYPHITFGRYTGDTEEDPKRAVDAFGELNIGEPILPNEILSRHEMRKAPPHLLLTNYAMLEYLLLRPRDMELFAAGDESQWRFIVVDEAHVYDGSQGAEVAMLLRRVRDRVASSRPIQCIATSATVGGDAPAVTAFAGNLFGQTFEWVEGDVDRQDLVLATRVASPEGPFWGPLTTADYIELAARGEDAGQGVLDCAARYGWDIAPDATAADVILHEQSLATLRRTLAPGPRAVEVVAATVFGPGADAQQGLAAMVEVASRLRARRRDHRHLGALPPLPAGHRRRLQLPVRPGSARAAGPAHGMPRLRGAGFRDRLVQALRGRARARHADSRRQRHATPASPRREPAAPGTCSASMPVSPTRTKRPSPTTGRRSREARRCCARRAASSPTSTSAGALPAPPRRCDRCAS